jgi:hypothetical protein
MKMYIINLTKSQRKKLQPLQDEIDKAVIEGHKGMIIAQVWPEFLSMKAGFVPGKTAITIMGIMKNEKYELAEH